MKKPETIELENMLMRKTRFDRTFGCGEVTIGWYGDKRVDFMETNTKGLVRCYEIKVSKSDFHSEHGHNFVGNYNYYVLTKELYKEVMDEVPDDVGIYIPSGKELRLKKKAKKRKISDSRMLLYLIRSMSREIKKNWESKDVQALRDIKRAMGQMERKIKDLREENNKLNKELVLHNLRRG